MKRLTICTLLLLLSGCASLIGKRAQVVTFNSYPSGANVFLDDRLIGKTPISINLNLDRSKTVSKIVGNKEDADESDTDMDDIAQEISMIEGNTYKLVYFLDGYKPIYFYVSPQWMKSSKGPNYSLCLIDITLSVITFGIPIIIDNKSNSCTSFEPIYSYNLESRSVNTTSEKTIGVATPTTTFGITVANPFDSGNSTQ